MSFEPVALKPLDLERLTLDGFFPLLRYRQTEHSQPTVLLQNIADAPGNTVAGLSEAALPGLCFDICREVRREKG